MAEKRRFYNTEDAKGFTKKAFFEAVLKMANGDEIDEDTVDLIARAAEYELEGIAARPAKTGTGERKDPLHSAYANALREAILPLVTGEAKSANELVTEAAAKGLMAPAKAGKEQKAFAAPWTSRVLNHVAENPDEYGVKIMVVKKVVEKVDSKGLKSQSEVTAYKRG